MKPSTVRSPASLSIWVNPLSSDRSLAAGFAVLRFGPLPGEYYLAQNRSLVTVRLRAPRQQPELDRLLGSGRAQLATIEQVAKDGAVALTIRFFNGALVEIGAVDIGLDDHIHARGKQFLKAGRAGIGELTSLLTELCALRLGSGEDNCYFLLTTGAAAVPEFAAGSGDPSTQDLEVARAEQAFCIHGDGLRIAVAKKQVAPDKARYLATRLIGALSSDPDGAVRLARGRLTFSDFTRSGQIQALAAGAMAQLMERESGYLKKWDEYGAIEGEMLLARARRVGMLRWQNAEPQAHGKRGVKFFFAERLPASLAPGDELEILTAEQEEPVYLRLPEMTWAQFMALLETEYDTKKSATREPRQPREKGKKPDRVIGEVLSLTLNSLVLDLPMPPTKAGLSMTLSLSGEQAQIERRMVARRRILEGRSANPMLGLIIEEGGVPPQPLRTSNIPPLTAFVRQKVFPHPPTAKQQDAIRIALNTPDIALIQGPPGTGKTTVIAAIIERLNELADKGRSIQGEVLISAFQHDAIENMMAKLTVNAIPVPKFGRRSNSLEVGDRNVERMRRWCEQLASRLRKKNPGLRVSEKLHDAQRRCQDYVLRPSLDNAIGIIDAFLQLPEGQLPERIVSSASELRQRLTHERDGRVEQADSDLLRALWSLRTSREGFGDDGPAMAQGLLALCGAELPQSQKEILTRAASWRSAEPPPFLAELQGVKSTLLEWYLPRAAFRIDKPRSDVLDFVAEASQRLQAREASSAERTDSILAEFLHELESNPTAAQRAAEDYGFAFAATCQQSQGRAITQRKSEITRTGGPDYDTVIIDEAARSSPRDLLIPMSQARTRIILVGDHRQLPHMIDEEIARSLEERSSASTERAAVQEEEHIRRSMFQYLLSRLKQLHARDKITRWVTLDQQFRMHPLLGTFVSDYFYRVHDPNEAFTSPLPEANFLHVLPGIPEVPAIWIDVPSGAGEEEQLGTSRRRESEAHEIAQQLARWIDTPAGRQLTFGIISFYKAQVAEIFEALAQGGYTTRGPNDTWQIAENYALRPAEEKLPPEERLRIGTVDSFQGMEFDVVFLSMVRSKGRLPTPSADPAVLTKQEQGAYGHLTSPNRLCVSMSRQKRLLVVVGDRNMVESELAQSAVPGLIGFLELCKTRGAVLPAGGLEHA